MNPSHWSCKEKEGWLLLIKWHYGKGGRCHCNWGHTVVRITGYFCQTGGQRKQKAMKCWPSETSQGDSGTAGAQGNSLQQKLQEFLVLVKVPHGFYIKKIKKVRIYLSRFNTQDKDTQKNIGSKLEKALRHTVLSLEVSSHTHLFLPLRQNF